MDPNKRYISLTLKKKPRHYSFLFFLSIWSIKSFFIIGREKKELINKTRLTVMKAIELFKYEKSNKSY